MKFLFKLAELSVRILSCSLDLMRLHTVTAAPNFQIVDPRLELIQVLWLSRYYGILVIETAENIF